MREPQIERAGRGEAGAVPAVSALNGEQPEGLTGRAVLPPEVGVQARYERLAVTHAITIGQLPTLSIGFIDKAGPSPGRSISEAPASRTPCLSGAPLGGALSQRPVPGARARPGARAARGPKPPSLRPHWRTSSHQEPLMYHGAHWRCESARAERINVEDPASTEDLVPQGVPKAPHNPDPPH
jgi:hypothetical protein